MPVVQLLFEVGDQVGSEAVQDIDLYRIGEL